MSDYLISGCRWGGGCDHPDGFGETGRFCASHAERLLEVRERMVAEMNARKGRRRSREEEEDDE